MGACCDTNQRQGSIISKNPFSQLDMNFGELKYDKVRKENWDNVILGYELIETIIKAKTSKQVIQYLEEKQKISPIIFESIRAKTSNYKVEIDGELINTAMWNPVMYAIANPNKLLELVKYMIEVIGVHTGLSLKEPIYDSELDGILESGEKSTAKFWKSTLALSLAIKNCDIEMLEYLWNDHYFLWDITDLDQLMDTLYNYEFLDALSVILRGKTFVNIILSLSFDEQVFYIEKILFDKFDQDTQDSICTFIDDALASNKNFGTQYLYLNLKREHMLKDLIDVCLRNSNHYMIYQNYDMFQWIFENMDPDVKQDLRITQLFIEKIIEGNKQVIELKFVNEEILRLSQSGNIQKIVKLIEHGKIQEIAQIRDKEGIVFDAFEEREEMINTCGNNYGLFDDNAVINVDEEVLKEWNPLHVAIFYNQLKLVKYFCDNLKINVQASLKMPGYRKRKNMSSNYQSNSKDQISINNGIDCLLLFVLECLRYNLKKIKVGAEDILLYFWDYHGYLFNDLDLKIMIEYLFKLQRDELLTKILFIPTSVYIIKNMPFEKRLIYLKEIQYIAYQFLGKEKYFFSEQANAINGFDKNKKEIEQNQSLQFITELLTERPYSLYCIFLTMEKSPFFFKQAYQMITAQDIEELIRCSHDRAVNITEIKNGGQKKRQELMKEIRNFEEIKDAIYELGERILNSPLLSRVNSRKLELKEDDNSRMQQSQRSRQSKQNLIQYGKISVEEL
ncbi:UNKNOWN [Stylonychia lemnae]|uniref:Ankyrin repeat protein n=1 Tax=Stylonychia lemnae TaxID=5949 RepID=A0A078AUJ9_STYLE|nr:UNKNOWN [Stylonychia lemnae]|eukprot:CDW84897.1 UNKNOWN [Stylonychia lemnae]